MGLYEFEVYSSRDEVPAQVLKLVHEDVLNGLGCKFSILFPAFSLRFPCATKVVESVWGVPRLVVSWKRNFKDSIGVARIFSERDGKTLFFPFIKPAAYQGAWNGIGCSGDIPMLPVAWCEIYSLFDSFGVTELGYFPSHWVNTPFSFSSRLNLEDYRGLAGVSKKNADRILSGVGCGKSDLVCWLLTGSGDALFVDSSRCDRKIYHVSSRDFGAVVELDDPAAALDQYLANYLMCGETDFSRFACGEKVKNY